MFSTKIERSSTLASDSSLKNASIAVMGSLLRVARERALDPDDDAEQAERAWRQHHDAVVDVAGFVEALRDDPHAEQRARAEDLANGADDREDPHVPEAVADAVEEA